jgi:hypothetical protein
MTEAQKQLLALRGGDAPLIVDGYYQLVGELEIEPCEAPAFVQ